MCSSKKKKVVNIGKNYDYIIIYTLHLAIKRSGIFAVFLHSTVDSFDTSSFFNVIDLGKFIKCILYFTFNKEVVLL